MDPIVRLIRTNSRSPVRYPLRSRGRHGENRKHSAPATVTAPASKVLHPIQILPEQRHIHFVDSTGSKMKYCEENRPKVLLEASKQRPLLSSFMGPSSSFPRYHFVRFGRGHLHPSHSRSPKNEHGLGNH
eukprot:scaffold202074_cov17-Tisochrysis_lutea.AAC.2